MTSGDGRAPGLFRIILRGEDSAHRRGRTSIKQGKNPAPVYVVVHMYNARTSFDISYVLFYHYNGPTSKIVTGLGGHEADFEHVSVRLRRGTNTLLGVYYSAHGSEEQWHLPGDFNMFGSHPVVYSARSSHANYNKPGTYKRIGVDLGITGIHFAADECDYGYRWNTWQNVIDVGSYDKPLNKQLWRRFGGRWGRFKDAGCFGLCLPYVNKLCLFDYPFDEEGSKNIAAKNWFYTLKTTGPN